MRKAIVASLCLIFSPAAVQAQSPSSTAVHVTVDNFARAESDNYMVINAAEAGIGKLAHRREPASIDHQTVIRLNRDTLYSFGVFDLAAGPVTITLPDAGKRFMSLQIINEDHYVPSVFYDHASHTLTQENVGTRYMMVAVRTLVDPNDPKDLDDVHKLQDAIKVSQSAPGKLELPNWDPGSLKEIRDALLVLAKHTDGFQHAFGTKTDVDSVKHLIGTAAAGAAIRTRMRPISALRSPRTTERPSTSSASGKSPWTPSGRSASTMRRAISKKTLTTPIRSTTLRRRKTPTARSRSSSAVATENSRTAYRSCPAGTIR
jgi:hypothetical protein